MVRLGAVMYLLSLHFQFSKLRARDACWIETGQLLRENRIECRSYDSVRIITAHQIKMWGWGQKPVSYATAHYQRFPQLHQLNECLVPNIIVGLSLLYPEISRILKTKN